MPATVSGLRVGRLNVWILILHNVLGRVRALYGSLGLRARMFSVAGVEIGGVVSIRGLHPSFRELPQSQDHPRSN